MSIEYKGTIVWAILMTFLNLLMFRIDEKITCNWFIVFIPMWVLDLLLLVSSFAQLSGRSNRIFITDSSWKAQTVNLTFICSKIILEVLVCLRQEFFPGHLRFVHLLVPLVPLFATIGVGLVVQLRRIVRMQADLL